MNPGPIEPARGWFSAASTARRAYDARDVRSREHGARSGMTRIPRALAAAATLVSCGGDAPASEGARARRAQPLAAAPIRVAAASDLASAFDQVGRAFERATGHEVVITFGASGVLARQLREGAPFDLFASADSGFVRDVVAAGSCDPDSEARYAHGQLVVWSRRGLVAPPASLADLADARFRRIAIANPDHAPYGRAARQALEKLGLWAALQARIVYGENNRQAHQFAQSGNAEAALVALSLVIDGEDGAYVPVDAALHAPIDHTLVACTHGENAAGGRAFARFVAGPRGRKLLQRHGLTLPDEPRSRER
jgi:molybdate transport system substrate-binding protein